MPEMNKTLYINYALIKKKKEKKAFQWKWLRNSLTDPGEIRVEDISVYKSVLWLIYTEFNFFRLLS